ncbi:hypothetical protein QWY96_19290 [Vibrio artabrorum]|uniref:Uncharacterized protein n=1 Tax=Vibrio artabrorum TaxID=446374 RepID=A0ABT8CPS6_9VIBR|nr:hypothetical protein [Vibrio artabrorum]MDN3702523.1 hypothetical protein [Vibrio artabrorum]
MDTKVTTQERENRSEIKLPSVIIKHDNISKYKVNLSFSYPYSESKPTTIMLNYLTSKEVNLKTNYKPGSDTVTLTFDKPLEAPVYIRAMAKGKDYMSTIVLDNKDIIPSTSYIVDGKNIQFWRMSFWIKQPMVGIFVKLVRLKVVYLQRKQNIKSYGII